MKYDVLGGPTRQRTIAAVLVYARSGFNYNARRKTEIYAKWSYLLW